MGPIRATLVLPISLVTSLSSDQWEAILAHELAHVKRLDFLFNLIQIVIEIMLFHHPAVWWLGRKIRREREFCCDDVSAAICQNSIALTEALAALASSGHSASTPSIALAANGSGDSLALHRVRRLLLGAPISDRVNSGWLAGIIAPLALFTAVAFAVDFPTVDPPPLIPRRR
jgi:beta-lactamase regulating signal transducer with metallopeptidase domain